MPCSRRSGGPTRTATPSRITVGELELADPGPTELLVRIEAAGICHSDLSVVDGNRPRPVPMLLGHEAAGIVEAVGDQVGDVAVGDRVVLTFLPRCGECAGCATNGRLPCERGSALERARASCSAAAPGCPATASRRAPPRRVRLRDPRRRRPPLRRPGRRRRPARRRRAARLRGAHRRRRGPQRLGRGAGRADHGRRPRRRRPRRRARGPRARASGHRRRRAAGEARDRARRSARTGSRRRTSCGSSDRARW